MLDHVGVAVADLARAKAFYSAALAPLGIRILYELSAWETGGEAFAGYGDTRPRFWLGTGEALRGSLHIAFAAKDRAAVDAFHAAALEAGGRDNGKPGLRPHYHAEYYGAFVLDPDGHNVEAVFHGNKWPPAA